MKLVGNLNENLSGNEIPSGQFHQPRSCAVIPNRTTDPEGFIDARNKIKGQAVFVSVTALREMGQLVGLIDEKEVEKLTVEFADTEDDLRGQIETLRNQLDALQTLEDARELVDAADAEEASVAA